MEDNKLEIVAIQDLKPEITKKIQNFIVAKKDLDEQYKSLTDKLKKTMEETCNYSYKDDYITISYTCASNPIGVDLDKLKTQYPDVYADCLKAGFRGSSVKITLTKPKDKE